MNRPRVRRLLQSVLDELETARISAMESDRELASVLDQTIAEMSEAMKQLEAEEDERALGAFISTILKVLVPLIELAKVLFGTLPCKAGPVAGAITYARYLWQLARTSRYFESRPDFNRKSWQKNLGRPCNT